MSNIQRRSAASPKIIEYLCCLNLKVEAPSLNYLERICHAHLNTFPFENISKLISFSEGKGLPSIENFIENHSVFDFGGTCYTLNSNLYILLKELGFDCHLVMLGKEHMAVIVVIENVKFYVDCGAAAPFLKPVDFKNNDGNKTEFGSERIEILPVEPNINIYEYVRFNNGEPSGKPWRFDTSEEFQIEDFNEVILKSNQIGATFMTILRCQIWQTAKNRSVSLVNNKLKIGHANGNNETRLLRSVEEIQNVLEEEFQLPKLPVIEAIEILKEIKIDIFAETH